MATRDPVEVDLEQLRNDAVTVRNAHAQTYKALPLDDPRRLVSRHIKAVISSTYLSRIHLVDNVTDPSWWQRHFNGAPPNVQDEVDDYAVLLTAAFVLYPFALFEAGTRRIVRAIDATACSGGAAEFKGIYDWLIARLGRSGWTYSGGELVAFLDLYRHVRNAHHNNAAYYSRTGTDTSITWRGQTYDFNHGQRLGFIDWPFNIAVVRELIHVNDEIMRAPLVAALPTIS